MAYQKPEGILLLLLLRLLLLLLLLYILRLLCLVRLLWGVWVRRRWTLPIDCWIVRGIRLTSWCCGGWSIVWGSATKHLLLLLLLLGASKQSLVVRGPEIEFISGTGDGEGRDERNDLATTAAIEIVKLDSVFN